MLPGPEIIVLFAVGACVALPLAHIGFARGVLAKRDDLSPQKSLVLLTAALNVPLALGLGWALRSGAALDVTLALVFALTVYNGFGYAYFHFFNLSETGRRVRMLTHLRAGALEPAALETGYSAEHMVRARLKRLEQMGQVAADEHGRYRIRGRLLLIAAHIIGRLGSLLFPRHG